MGTEQEIIEIQSFIKKIASELGWTQNRLARIIYTEIYDFDDDEEIRKFQEKFKKELQRTTTKLERLKEYVDILIRHPEAKNINLIFNKKLPKHSISLNIISDFYEISHEIDKIIKK